LKEEALDRAVWRTRFRRRYGPVVRETTTLMNVYNNRVVVKRTQF